MKATFKYSDGTSIDVDGLDKEQVKELLRDLAPQYAQNIAKQLYKQPLDNVGTLLRESQEAQEKLKQETDKAYWKTPVFPSYPVWIATQDIQSQGLRY